MHYTNCSAVSGDDYWFHLVKSRGFEAPLQQVSLTPGLLSPKTYILKTPKLRLCVSWKPGFIKLNVFTIKLYSHSHSPFGLSDTDIFLTLNFITHKFTYHTLIWLNPLTSISRTFGRYSSEFAFSFLGAQKGKKASLPLYPESIFSFLGKALYHRYQAPSIQVKLSRRRK